MRLSRLLSRPFAWLAMLAVMQTGLLPAFASAIVRQPALQWQQLTGLCTAGPATSALARSGADVTKQASHAGGESKHQHCPLCYLPASGHALAPVDGVRPTAALGSSIVPSTFLRAARTQFAWATVHARGPPIAG